MSQKKVHSSNPRVLAVQVLARVSDGAYSNLQLNQVIQRHQLDDRDRRLLTTLVYGVIQHRLTLTYWLAPHIADKKLDPWVVELLLTALYQMTYLDKIPNHAIVNETIDAAKCLGHRGIAKFVTAILHRLLDQPRRDETAIADVHERWSVMHSVPRWLVDELAEQLGDTKTEQILATINQPPKQSVRVNTTKVTVAEAMASLEAAGCTVTPSPIFPDALAVSGGHVASTDAYQQGWVTLQDESAMLPVASLRLNDQVTHVLDAAAAPGGKTLQIAQATPATTQIMALDIHKHKLKLIQSNAARFGFAERITPQLLDARDVPVMLPDTLFDRILVDAPCSGLGLLRRKPEIRYDKTLADVTKLAALQLSMLTAVCENLAPNGILVYSTCTILDQENSAVVADFLASCPDMVLVPTQTPLTPAPATADPLRIYPDDYASDGFFVATFQKKAR